MEPEEKLLWAIKNTKEFQRLKNITQLGGVRYALFDGATHTRYEHSEGVCKLAGELLTSLRARCPDYNITKRDILCVQIAGLCYSLGHGPYSHTFYQYFMKRAFEEDTALARYNHVDMSCKILEEILKKDDVQKHFKEAGLCDDDVDFIKALMKGEPQKGLRPPEKDFLYEVVSNTYNGIDVKLWDYMQRDLQAVGDKKEKDSAVTMYSPDELKKIIKKLQDTAIVMDVVDNGIKRSHIVYHHKVMVDIRKLFSFRDMLYRRVYKHTDTSAMEMTICDDLWGDNEKDQWIRAGDEYPSKSTRYVDLTNEILSKKSEAGFNPSNSYKCIGEVTTFVKKDGCKKTIKTLEKHLMKKLKSLNLEDVKVEVVEYRDELDQKKVWLYKDDYCPFTMDSAKKRVFVLSQKQSFQQNRKNGLIYDENRDVWLINKDSFEVDCFDMFEPHEFAECSIRLYLKNGTREDIRQLGVDCWTARWKLFEAVKLISLDERILCVCKALHQAGKCSKKIFHPEGQEDTKGKTDAQQARNNAAKNKDSVTREDIMISQEDVMSLLEHECNSFLLKERLKSTTYRASIVLLPALLQGFMASGWRPRICSTALTYIAGWSSLWLYDCLQRNKQRLQLPNEDIKKIAGGVFIVSTALIGFVIPFDHYKADISKVIDGKLIPKTPTIRQRMFSTVKTNVMRFLMGEKWLRWHRATPTYKTYQMRKIYYITMRTRALKGVFGGLFGSLALLGSEDLYLRLNFSRAKVESE